MIFVGGGGVTFEIGEDAMGPSMGPPPDEEDRGWECVWRCVPATPVLHMAFSPDGTLFATAGRNDRLVKIWFENKQCKSKSVSVYSFLLSYSVAITVFNLLISEL